MKKFFVLFILAFISALSVNAQSDIRKVDFANFVYEVNLFEEKPQKIKVEDGNYSRDTEDEKVFFSAKVTSYGDLDGDGREEAVIQTMLNTGGTGNFSTGLVFTMKGGKPVILTDFEGGDRAYGGLISSKIEDGLLIVEQYDVGEAGGACCPEFVVTTTYKWNGKSLSVLGIPDRRELYPTTRISFKKGTSVSTLPLKIEKYDRKRFVVGARKGQTLLVSSATKGISYNLFKGEGDVENTDNGMIVKLKENGDFVFEVSNDNDQDIEFSITVEIN